MADVRGSSAVCDDTCGCPSPCIGGTSCKCAMSGSPDEATGMDHNQCSCGEHCGCNPCTCSKTPIRGTGKAFCKCGAGCTCPTCAA